MSGWCTPIPRELSSIPPVPWLTNWDKLIKFKVIGSDGITCRCRGRKGQACPDLWPSVLWSQRVMETRERSRKKKKKTYTFYFPDLSYWRLQEKSTFFLEPKFLITLFLFLETFVDNLTVPLLTYPGSSGPLLYTDRLPSSLSLLYTPSSFVPSEVGNESEYIFVVLERSPTI